MMSETGIRKGAILLMALGEDHAAAVLQRLDQPTVQRVGTAVARLGLVSRDEVAAVLHEFRGETEQLSALHLGSGDYIRAVLKKALGDDKASALLEDILQAGEPHTGLDRLNQLEAIEVAELIRDEHPQILATVLIHLDRHKSSEVLQHLPARLRDDVIMRIATFGGVQPSALAELTEVLSEMLSGQGLKRSRLGGVRTAAEIVNLMASAQEEETIANVRALDETLAQRIVDEMFVFENLLGLEDRSIQRLLKDIEAESLIVALKGAPEELRDKFLANMSQRAAEALREEIALRPPVRVSQVETEQKAILQTARRLAEANEIIISTPGADDFV